MSENHFRKDLLDRLAKANDSQFEELALLVFQYQATSNAIYRSFLELLQVDYTKITTVQQIPFLPIQLFKQYELKSAEWVSSMTFSSSGTTGMQTSNHALRDPKWYFQNSKRGFEYFYGPLKDYCVLALLPSYLERSGSSLVFMVDQFIRHSPYKESGFFLYNTDELLKIIINCKKNNIPTLLIGVSFALLDLAEKYSIDLGGLILMETGGMKGRRKEITRAELHERLKKAFGLTSIHSEYGMTELLSQAYSRSDGLFYPAPTMRVLTRELTDPLTLQKVGKTGGVNIIDLANLDTISFIATEDLGRVYADGGFEILGRFDASDIRGCNLLID